MLRWYLIYTKLANEGLALENLARQHYEAYLPRVVQTVRRGGRRHDRVGALFPRYLFLRLNEVSRRSLRWPPRSGCAASSASDPATPIVPDRVIRDLQARADPVSGLHRLSFGQQLQRGAAVRIRLGPFDGLEGVFEREVGTERVLVLLSLLGRSTAVCVSTESVMLRQAV